MEKMIGDRLVHKWEREKNGEFDVNCDYWDCTNNIGAAEYFYYELYPDGNAHRFCLECSAAFMSYVVNDFMEVGDG